MPLLNNSSLEQAALTTNAYGYSATRLDALGAAEYTLVTVICDVSGSVSPFKRELENTLQSIVQACRQSPRADNLMLRLVAFDDSLREVHGFKLLEHCHLNDYTGVLKIGGTTALYDAAENAVCAATDYAVRLGAGDFAANAIVFIVTDGMDNASILTARAVQKAGGLCFALDQRPVAVARHRRPLSVADVLEKEEVCGRLKSRQRVHDVTPIKPSPSRTHPELCINLRPPGSRC